MEEQPPLQRLEEVGQFCTAKDFGFGPACPSSLHSLALTWASRGWVVPIVEMRSPFVFRAMVHISFRFCSPLSCRVTYGRGNTVDHVLHPRTALDPALPSVVN